MGRGDPCLCGPALGLPTNPLWGLLWEWCWSLHPATATRLSDGPGNLKYPQRRALQPLTPGTRRWPTLAGSVSTLERLFSGSGSSLLPSPASLSASSCGDLPPRAVPGRGPLMMVPGPASPLSSQKCSPTTLQDGLSIPLSRLGILELLASPTELTSPAEAWLPGLPEAGSL